MRVSWRATVVIGVCVGMLIGCVGWLLLLPEHDYLVKTANIFGTMSIFIICIELTFALLKPHSPGDEEK